MAVDNVESVPDERVVDIGVAQVGFLVDIGVVGGEACSEGDVEKEVVEYGVAVVFIFPGYGFNGVVHQLQPFAVRGGVGYLSYSCNVDSLYHRHMLSLTLETVCFHFIAVGNEFPHTFVATLLL